MCVCVCVYVCVYLCVFVCMCVTVHTAGRNEEHADED